MGEISIINAVVSSIWQFA